VLLAILASPSAVFAEVTGNDTVTSIPDQSNEIINESADSDDLKNIEKELDRYSTPELKKIIPELDTDDFIKNSATGKLDLNLKTVGLNALNYLFNEIYQNLHILLKIIILIVVCAVLKNLQASFLSDSAGEVAFYVCYIVVVSLLLISFNTAMKLGIEIIDGMIGFMYATMPVLITLLVSGGNVTSGAVFQPALIMLVEVSATVIKNLFIPLIFLSAILSIVNNISEKIQISRLTGLIKQITGWTLGIMLTVFIAVISIQGSLGAVVDGVTSKTAKFAIGTFIPVAGKYLADAADTVIGCTLLIKNAAGVAVMIGIIAICIVPLLKIAALVLIYKAAGALVEPVSDKRLTSCINDVAGSIVYVLGIASSVTFMFLITITAIISAGTMSAMIR
jgi:stage III sporulation protein AE